MESILSVVCEERKGSIERKVYPLVFTPENYKRLYEEASKFPIIFGKKLDGPEDFNRYFFTTKDNKIWPTGLFWVIDDFVGIFYLTDIYPTQADAHFTFFDKKLEGRDPLIKEMVRFVFKEYPTFNRLNVSVPCYANTKIMKMVSRIGFTLEGKRRSSSFWQGQLFDTLLYGILRQEI